MTQELIREARRLANGDWSYVSASKVISELLKALENAHVELRDYKLAAAAEAELVEELQEKLRTLIKPQDEDKTYFFVNIRSVTVGNAHAEPGDPQKVARMYQWLMDNPALHLSPLDARMKPNGTYRIHDGRHRFCAYVLAERDTIPIIRG